MAGKIFGYHGSIFWNIDPIQLNTLAIDTFCMRHKNDSNLDDENIPMLRAEQMNLKLSINLSLRADTTGDALTQVAQAIQEFLLVFFLVRKKASSNSIVQS